MTNRSLRLPALIVGAAVSLIASAATVQAQTESSTSTPAVPTTPDWLTVVNAYRTSAGLPPVVNDPALQAGQDAEVKYMIATGDLSHLQMPSAPGYTPEGDLAARQSVLSGWAGAQKDDRELVDSWLSAPFHSIHIFEPRLKSVSFASARSSSGALNSAAALNIIGGVGPRVTITRPVLFPADGTTVGLTSFPTENPNPLTSCPGYSFPVGSGILAIFPKPISPATGEIRVDGRLIESCIIDSTYVNPDPSSEATARQILTQKNAMVLIPRSPLIPGSKYQVNVSGANTQSTSWSFSVATPGSVLPTPGTYGSVIQDQAKTTSTGSGSTTRMGVATSTTRVSKTTAKRTTTKNKSKAKA